MILPSNSKVTDTKPNNRIVVDQKPNNKIVTDVKPNNYSIYNPTQIYYLPTGTVTIPAGQWIPFAGLTYPQSITMVTPGGVRP